MSPSCFKIFTSHSVFKVWLNRSREQNIKFEELFKSLSHYALIRFAAFDSYNAFSLSCEAVTEVKSRVVFYKFACQGLEPWRIILHKIRRA